MSTAIRYVAEPTHVREVSLLGTADLDFWTARLRKEKLQPVQQCGHAQILIVAGEMTYMGLRFTEVSFAVVVSVPEDRTRNAAFLIHAFNSCRLFAFCERQFFATPYSHAECRVSVSEDASILVSLGGKTVFRAEMPSQSAVPTREPSRSDDTGWEGIVFLPGSQCGSDARLFFTRIRGHALAFPFVQSADAVAITPSTDTETLQVLLDSKFTGEEWLVRTDATHGKSKTFRRRDIFGCQTYDPVA